MLECNKCVTALSIKLGVISDLITLVILATIVSSYDKVSANTASSVSKTSKFQSSHRVVKMVLNT